MDHDSISTARQVLDNHDHTLVTIALNLLDHYHVRLLLNAHPLFFGAFHALLKPRISYPENFSKVMEEVGVGAGTADFDREKFQRWRQEEGHPFLGRMPENYLENFYEGVELQRYLSHRRTLWDDTFNQLKASLLNQEGNLHSWDLKPACVDTKTQIPTENASTFHANLAVLGTLLELNETEMSLLEVSYLLAHDLGFRLLMDMLFENNFGLSWEALLPRMIGQDEEDIEAGLDSKSNLMRSGILESDSDPYRVVPMGEFWHQWFSSVFESTEDMFARFIVPLEKKANAGAIGRLHEADRAILMDAIQGESECETGRNVLLYGPASVDKIGMVHDLLADVGIKGYALNPKIKPRDLASAAAVAQHCVTQLYPDSVLLIDQADQVLTRTRRGTHHMAFFVLRLDTPDHDNVGDEGLISGNPAPSIWLVNDVETLSEDNVGRFLYVAPVKTASRAERRQEIEKILAPLDLREKFHQELATHLSIGEQQLKSALRLTTDALQKGAGQWVPEGMEHGSVEHREYLVRRCIEQGQQALGRLEKEHLRQPLTQYSLDLLNIASSFTVDQVIDALRRRPSSTLCFYGLPGTGKTQLAEHMAVALDRPILMYRASDLINKYIGESEKNIRKMFREAEANEAILFLDEADSFMQDRSNAMHTWETSSVNEMLQGMERFRGIFICATNLFEKLDRAALRRFTFKLEFLELNEDQRWLMFCNEAGLDVDKLSQQDLEYWKQELAFLPLLTPGDFATVKRQVDILDVVFTPEQWLHALQHETRVKKEEYERRLRDAQIRRMA